MTSYEMTKGTPAFERPAGRARRKRRDWGRAFTALRRLAADHEDTSQVYEIKHALDGDAYEVDYVRILSTPYGGRIAYERVELADRLQDEALRASFPAGSVGAAYVEFQRTEHISVQGLIDESHKGVPPEDVERLHPYAWFFRRSRDIHDLVHILTGYGRDVLGEICLLTFTFQETHDLGRAFIAVAAFLRAHGPAASQARKAILEARRRGKSAAWLPAEDFERLLFEPLAAARGRLGLHPPAAYDAVPPTLRNLTMA